MLRLDRPVGDGESENAAGVRDVVRGDGQPFTERGGRDEQINLADQLAATFEVGPDLGSRNSMVVRKG